ncbi:pseudouridine synthase [Alishewanella longhuensis]
MTDIINNEPLRLAKLIAQSGLCSRKEASRLISKGQVRVNGEMARHLHAITDTDQIDVAGVTLAAPAPLQYWLYHKPVGIDCNNRPEDPASIAQLLRTLPVRLFAVGRLDKDSRGMLLLTNDGAFAQRLLHPNYAHQKSYLVTLDQATPPSIVNAFSQGISWQVGPHSYQAKPCQVQRLNARQLEIILTEGQHRQIRYMCRALGFKVVDLCRTAIGTLSLGTLAAGDCRQLNAEELTQLLTLQAPKPTT